MADPPLPVRRLGRQFLVVSDVEAGECPGKLPGPRPPLNPVLMISRRIKEGCLDEERTPRNQSPGQLG